MPKKVDSSVIVYVDRVLDIRKKDFGKEVIIMRSVLFCVLFILFSSPVLAGTQNLDAKGEDYIEGEVIVIITALRWSDYEPDYDAFSQAILSQAEAFAAKYGLRVEGHPLYTTAMETGKNIFLLSSEHKSTGRLVREILSDPDVIDATPNHIIKFIDDDKDSAGCNVGYGGFLLLLAIALFAKRLTGKL